MDSLRAAHISSKWVVIPATVVAVLLVLASLATKVCIQCLGFDDVPGDQLLDVNGEANIPAYFSTMLLALATALLYIIGAATKSESPKQARPWLALAIVFLYLSADEAARFHEMARDVPREALPDWGGIFHWQWVIFAIPAVAILGLAFLRFLVGLPVDTRRLFVLAGAMFVTGALGLELVAGALLHADAAPIWLTVGESVEELLEMLGVILFIHALFRYIRLHLPRIELAVDRPSE